MYPFNSISITQIANGYLILLPERAGFEAVARPVRRGILDKVIGSDSEYDLADIKQSNVYMFAELTDALDFVKVTLTKEK